MPDGAQDLTLAHDIVVRKHHGTISLESEPVHGATFIIRLPIEDLRGLERHLHGCRLKRHSPTRWRLFKGRAAGG